MTILLLVPVGVFAGWVIAIVVVEVLDRLGLCYRASREKGDGVPAFVEHHDAPAASIWKVSKRPVGRTYSQARSDLRRRIALAQRVVA